MYIISLIVSAILIAVDQIAKYFAVIKLKPIQNITLIDGMFDLTFVENRGAAFGILSGRRWFFVILTLVVSAALIWAFIKMPKNKEYNFVRVSFVLIFSGAIGNMIDRALNGYVVDFFEFTFISFPVFNVADIYVVIGTALLSILIFFVIKDDEKK